MTRRHCLVLDLKDDPVLIAEYRRHHQQIWPEVAASMRASGIVDAEIYLHGTRRVMIFEVGPGFSFAAKAAADAADPVIQKWEQLMWRYQQPLPGSAPGEKWQPMERIFQLSPDR